MIKNELQILVDILEEAFEEGIIPNSTLGRSMYVERRSNG